MSSASPIYARSTRFNGGKLSLKSKVEFFYGFQDMDKYKKPLNFGLPQKEYRESKIKRRATTTRLRKMNTTLNKLKHFGFKKEYFLE